MRRELTAARLWHKNGKLLDRSRLAVTGSRAVGDETVMPLTLGERVLLSVGLLTVCLVVQADQLVARFRERGGDGRGVREARWADR
jgi:hypothetical protein